MIPKHVVKAFLRRQLDDRRYLKSCTSRELDAFAAKLPVQPPIWRILDRHQKVGLLFAAEYGGRAGLFYDTGMGKTLMSIAIVQYFRKLRKVKRVLVLVPRKINKSEWRRQLAKHSPSATLIQLAGSSEGKWQQLREPSVAVVETYAGLTRMCCTLVRVRTRSGKIINRLKPDKKKVALLVSKFDALILDESTAIVHKSSLIFRICRQLSKHAASVLALSGTPFGKTPEDLWGQMFLVDRGATLGATLGLFRAAFFSEHVDYFGHTSYVFKKSLRGKLNQVLANRSLRYEVKESDLPPLVPRVKEVFLPADSRVYLDRAKEAIKNAHGNYAEMKNAFLQMRQLSSGFLGYYDDELGTKAQYVFPQNPKLESILDTVDSVVDSHKAIIFYEFTFSSDLICRELRDMGIGHLRLYGKTKDVDGLLDKFDHDRNMRVLVMQNQMGLGPNIQIAKYGLYFEAPVSPIMRKQTQRRFERQHSQHDQVFRYDYVVRGTYDQRVLDALEEGKNLFDQIIDGKEAA